MSLDEVDLVIQCLRPGGNSLEKKEEALKTGICDQAGITEGKEKNKFPSILNIRVIHCLTEKGGKELCPEDLIPMTPQPGGVNDPGAKGAVKDLIGIVD